MNFLPSFVFVLFTVTSQYGEGLKAYDCVTEPPTNKTSYGDRCAAVTELTEMPEIKLLRQRGLGTIAYKSCSVVVSYVLVRRSTTLEVPVDRGGFVERVELGHAGCTTLHSERLYRLPPGDDDVPAVEGIRIDRPAFADRLAIVDKNGLCYGSAPRPANGSSDRVIVRATYEIRLSEGTAHVNYSEDSLILPTNNSTLNFSSFYGLDTDKTEVVWQRECENDEFRVIYEGPAWLMVAAGSPQTRTYFVQLEGMVFSLQTTQTVFLCGIRVDETDQVHTFVLTEDTKSHFKHSPPNTGHLTAQTVTDAIKNEFVYTRRLVESARYNDLASRRCESKRSVLMFERYTAERDLPEFAYRMGGGPGYMAVRSGDAIDLFRCKPVHVTISITQKSCYNELPVKYKGHTFFMVPKSRTLQRFGTEIDCDTLYPPAYKFDDDTWFTVVPKFRLINTPQILGAANIHLRWPINPEGANEYTSYSVRGEHRVYNVTKIYL